MVGTFILGQAMGRVTRCHGHRFPFAPEFCMVGESHADINLQVIGHGSPQLLHYVCQSEAGLCADAQAFGSQPYESYE